MYCYGKLAITHHQIRNDVDVCALGFDIIGASMASNSHDSMLLSTDGGTWFYHLVSPLVCACVCVCGGGGCFCVCGLLCVFGHLFKL